MVSMFKRIKELVAKISDRAITYSVVASAVVLVAVITTAVGVSLTDAFSLVAGISIAGVVGLAGLVLIIALIKGLPFLIDLSRSATGQRTAGKKKVKLAKKTISQKDKEFKHSQKKTELLK